MMMNDEKEGAAVARGEGGQNNTQLIEYSLYIANR